MPKSLSPLRIVRWFNQWAAGTYAQWSMVRDGLWTMISNKETSDRPAPQVAGNPEWITDIVGGLSFSTLTSSENIVAFGNRYTWSDAGVISGYRWYAPDASGSFTYEVWATITSDDGVSETQQLVSPISPSTIGWREIPVSNLIALQGTSLDLIVVGRSVAQDNTFTANWDVKNKNGTPDSKEAWFQNNSREIRVNNLDVNETNQSGNLQAVEIGARLLFAGQEWTVTDVDIRSSHVRYGVEPNQGRPSESERSLTFQWGSSDPIPYVVDSNFFSAYPEVGGFLDSTYPPTSTDQNAYGVDLVIDDIVGSPDWDFVSYSGSTIIGDNSGNQVGIETEGVPNIIDIDSSVQLYGTEDRAFRITQRLVVVSLPENPKQDQVMYFKNNSNGIVFLRRTGSETIEGRIQVFLRRRDAWKLVFNIHENNWEVWT